MCVPVLPSVGPKVNIVECVPFGCLSSRHVTGYLPLWPCLFSQSVCSAFIPDQISVCVCVCVCVKLRLRTVLACIYTCFLACACTLLLSSPVVFYLFPFLTTAWSNECLGLILLSPSSSSSSFTSLFPPFFICLFWSLFLLHFGLFFGFILPPPLQPSLFCDTASWDRSGRQPRSHTGQSTSHLNQPLNQYLTSQVNPIMLHSETLPFPTHPTDLPTLQLPRSSSLLHTPSPFFFFLSESRVERKQSVTPQNCLDNGHNLQAFHLYLFIYLFF